MSGQYVFKGPGSLSLEHPDGYGDWGILHFIGKGVPFRTKEVFNGLCIRSLSFALKQRAEVQGFFPNHLLDLQLGGKRVQLPNVPT